MRQTATAKFSTTLKSRILALVISSIFRTLRFSGTQNPPRKHSGGEIFAFWHGKMVVGWLLARELYGKDQTRCVVSPSRDGEILSHALERYGMNLMRGSSSKNREQLRESIKRELLGHHVIAITPDGPRGPVHRFKYGLLNIASELQAPLIFARIQCANSIKLRSWDEFEIPLPFSKVEIQLEPMTVPKFKDHEALQQYEKQLSRRLLEN